MRSILHKRFYYLKRRFNRHHRQAQLRAVMPPALAHRIDPLIDREQAQLLWNTRDQPGLSKSHELHTCIQAIFEHLSDRSNDWGMQIGHIVPRDPSLHIMG